MILTNVSRDSFNDIPSETPLKVIGSTVFVGEYHGGKIMVIGEVSGPTTFGSPEKWIMISVSSNKVGQLKEERIWYKE